MAWFRLQSFRSINFYTEVCLASSKIIHTYINISIELYAKHLWLKVKNVIYRNKL